MPRRPFPTRSPHVLGLYEDFFAPCKSPEVAIIPASYESPKDQWVGTNRHVMVIMVNKRALKGDPMPTTWSDLAHPRWKDRLILSDPEKTSSSLATLWGIKETIGPEPLKGSRRTPPSPAPPRKCSTVWPRVNWPSA
jgi:ABC-type Fe3+ transport system substrate-binding protein